MPKRKLHRGRKTQSELSPESAIAAIGLYSTFVDGEYDEEAETAALNEMLSAIDLYEDYSEDDFAALEDELATLFQDEGVESVIGQAIDTVRAAEVEEAALIVTMIVLVSDGEVPEEEQEYIDNLCEALGISQERALEIMDELFGEDEGEEDEDDEEYEEEE